MVLWVAQHLSWSLLWLITTSETCTLDIFQEFTGFDFDSIIFTLLDATGSWREVWVLAISFTKKGNHSFSLVLIPVLSYNSFTVLSICILGGQEWCCDWLRLAVGFLMQWSSITEMLGIYLRLVCGYCFNKTSVLKTLIISVLSTEVLSFSMLIHKASYLQNRWTRPAQNQILANTGQ